MYNLVYFSIFKKFWNHHCYSYFFNWRIIALKCCDGFCCTTWITYKYTYITSLLSLPASPAPSHRPVSSQSTRLSSLCCTAASHQLSVSHTVVSICQCYSLSSSHARFPPLCHHLCLTPEHFHNFKMESCKMQNKTTMRYHLHLSKWP